MFKMEKIGVGELLKKGSVKKFFKWFGISFGILFIIGSIYIGVVRENQISTLSSLKHVYGDDEEYPFYTMTYKGDYSFDEYLQKGSKDKKEYIDFIYKKILHEGGGLSYTGKPNCSSFTATTPNGDRLFARNLDTDIVTPLLLRTNPDNGYKSMSLVNIVWLNIMPYHQKLPLPLPVKFFNALGAPYFPLDGVNEHGLAISALTVENSSSFDSKDKISLNDYSLRRMVLDKASNVDEAVKMIKNYNMDFCDPSSPCHFMIADATGASVVIEYVNGEMQTVYSDKPYQTVTNFILYNNPYYRIDGLDRYQRIEAKLKETGGILTEKEAMKLLSENAASSEHWSVVYNLTQKKAYVRVGIVNENIYEFALD